MPIDMNGAAASVDALELALSRYRGAAANWEAATEYLHSEPGALGSDGTAGLELRDVVPLPPAFVSQYSSFQYKSYLGLFPEIGRAWLTADTRLFLWSYGEGRVLRGAPVADDFYAYDGFDQIIVTVALVRPRNHVFIDDVQYLVAVATPVEVTLLGVAFTGNGSAGELSLIPTNISVATDGVLMLSISSTPDGRIFMAGNDGNLHEFVYYGQSTGWASSLLGQRAAKRPRRVVHSRSSVVNYVIPSAVKDYFAPTDGLMDMAIDPDRNSLYTLSAAGCLSVYDILDHQNARLVRSVDISSHAKSLLSYSLPAADREYSCIFAVPSYLSRRVHLVVVTTFGERIYFASSNDSGTSGGDKWQVTGRTEAIERSGRKRSSPESQTQRPTLLRCVGYRGTPVRDAGISTERPCVHMAAWAAGSIVMCDLRAGLDDRLISIFPDPAAGRPHSGAMEIPGAHSSVSGDGSGVGSSVPGGATGGVGAAQTRPLLPAAGQARPAESVHQLSLGIGGRGIFGPASAGIVGGRDGDFGGAFSASGGRGGENTPAQNRSAAGQAASSQTVHAFAIAAVRTDEQESTSAVAADNRTVAPPLEPASMFWVLTPSAMRLYARVLPKQRLAAILSASTGGSDEYILEAFFSHHGVVEASATCVSLAISDPSLASSAARALYTHGGRSLSRPDRSHGWQGQPGVEGSGVDSGGDSALAGTPGRVSLFGMRRGGQGPYSGNRNSSGTFDLGRPTQRPLALASFSGVHDGFCVAIAKILRPLWHEHICTSRDPNAYQQMVFPAALLDESREAICGIVSFLDQYDPDSMLPFDDDDSGGSRDGRDGGTGGRSGQMRFSRGDGTGSLLGGPGSATPHSPVFGVQSSGSGHGSSRTIQDRLYGRSGLVRMKKSSEARRAEVGAIHNLKQLALRCSEALAFLSIFCDHQLHRVVPALHPGLRADFVNMQFCDLVARTPGATVSAALIEVLFSSFAAGGNDLGPLCKLLQNRCRSYFDDDDMTLQNGMQRIRAASDVLGISREDADPAGTDGERRTFPSSIPADVPQSDRDSAVKLAEEAVMLLKPLSNRIYNIESVCTQIAQVGAVPAAVELALAIGDGADRAADHSRAREAYNCILEMLGSLIQNCISSEVENGKGDEAGTGPDSDSLGRSPVSPAEGYGASRRTGRDLERKKDAALRVALSSTSDTFHDMLYTFLMRSKAGERELLSRPSARLDSYLQSEDRKDLLWKYYAQHGRHADAASVLVAMAEMDEQDTSLVDRLGFLSRALHNVKTAVSAGDVKAAALESDIKDYMDVARVQLRLREELARCHEQSAEATEAQKRLDSKVLDLTVLYNEFALPFELLESTLDVLRCGSYRDDGQVRELWMRIVDGELEETQVPALLEQRIVALGREFYPSDVAFPTRFLVELLERRSFENKGQPSWTSVDAGWVSNAMITIGVPLGEVVDSYRAMIESTPQHGGGTGPTQIWSWSDEGSQLHAIQGAERALSRWAERAVGGIGRYDVERRLLIAESEKARRIVALCKSRLRGMSATPAVHSLAQRLDAIESNVATPY